MTGNEKTCAAIHDLSGVGKCSLTAILPTLSVCGVECSALPTAFLSTHTGGFTDPVRRDMTDALLLAARHWKREGVRFSALYSGFLGSAGQIALVREVFELFREPEGLVLVDPVMGDGGKLYRTYTEEMAAGTAGLCARADIVTPNMTEACRLLGLPYDEGPYERGWIEDILQKLCKLGPRMAVLTGVSLRESPDQLGAACFDRETGEAGFSLLSKVPGRYYGTGDLFAAALLGGLLNGLSLRDACGVAAEYVHRAIEATWRLGADPRFGVKFEDELLWLGNKVTNYSAR